MKKFISLILAVITIMSICVPATANWYDDCYGGTYSLITHNGYVADTFCGVDAIYDIVNSKYQCNELVIRFYKEVYGLDVWAWSGVGFKVLTEGYEPKTPSVPHPGDVIFTSAEQRDGNGEHWAIVKSYENGVITLFEQNVVWQGKAGINRKLKYPSDGYYIYTVVAKDGYPDLVLKDASENVDTSSKDDTPSTDTNTSAPDSATIDFGFGPVDLNSIIKYASTFFNLFIEYILPVIKKVIANLV